MRGSAACDVSVVVPFTDDEDSVGALVGRVATHLRALGADHEILAVDEGSGDNSVPLLRLLRAHLPALRLLTASRDRGFAVGAQAARGRALLLWEPARAAAPVGPLAWARARVDQGADLVIVPGRYVVCRRTRAWRALAGARGRGALYEHRLARSAARHDLRVEGPANPAAEGWRPLVRLFGRR
jgi:hypothetical protein